MNLPALKWVSSPNISDRTAAVDLIVVHDCQGSYQGSIRVFSDPKNLNAHGTPNPVSAHFVLKDDGSEATQMVPLDKKAWHCMAFNSRSIGIEMAGFAERGFPDAEWQAAANIVAYLLHRYELPVRWAHGGVGSGFTSHFDLGKAGGGHSDPTTDARVWGAFMARVEKAYKAGGFPASWARGEPHVVPDENGPAVVIEEPAVAGIPAATRSIAWMQWALNKLGADPQLVVDGDLGPLTKAALMPWQFGQHIPTTGEMDAATVAALERAVAARG